ncbi:UNVERIFIED_CONTAM: Folate synthesis bifunctional protein, mitochondrial [Sesamum radiatum]|uniref:2-amino-4-hydroxy-6-hydroxymethyldihydropteridine diphosphokinase n=1 Tax=Sesamum radiatum TaxID=300843 RepID=A0AAW2MXU6_SESRA
MNIIKKLQPIKHGARAAKIHVKCLPVRDLCYGVMVAKWIDQLILKGIWFSSRKLVMQKGIVSGLSYVLSVEVNSEVQEVVIALGSNVGDRLHNFEDALERMKKSGIQIKRHGCLYETEPAYVTDQPHFLNSAVRGITKLEPHKLLGVLKEIERDMGRTAGIRYGPRPIDLDILFYGSQTVNTDILTIPHERIWERPFVMGPLIDLLGFDADNDTIKSWHQLSRHSGGLFEAWEKLGGESLIGKDGMKRVLPVANQLWNWSKNIYHGYS